MQRERVSRSSHQEINHFHLCAILCPICAIVCNFCPLVSGALCLCRYVVREWKKSSVVLSSLRVEKQMLRSVVRPCGAVGESRDLLASQKRRYVPWQAISVEPPLYSFDATITIGRNFGEEGISKVDRFCLAAHTLVTDSCLDNASIRRLDAKALAAERVAVGLGAHHAVWQGNLHVTVGIDIPATGTEAAIVVCHIAAAGIALALARTSAAAGS